MFACLYVHTSAVCPSKSDGYNRNNTPTTNPSQHAYLNEGHPHSLQSFRCPRTRHTPHANSSTSLNCEQQPQKFMRAKTKSRRQLRCLTPWFRPSFAKKLNDLRYCCWMKPTSSFSIIPYVVNTTDFSTRESTRPSSDPLWIETGPNGVRLT